MFQTRLKVIVWGLSIALAVLVLRLVDLQVVKAEYFKRRARAVLLLPPESLPFVRGRILDRAGVVLASDEPVWELQVDYGLIILDERYVKRAVRRHRWAGRYGADVSRHEARELFLAEVEQGWLEVAAFASRPVETIYERCQEIREDVSRIREAVRRRRGFDAQVREERQRHAILTGLDDQQQIRARLQLTSRYPWLHVESSTRRVYHNAVALAHILGRIAAVNADDVRNDPQADEPLCRYLPDDVIGRTGVERAAEGMLRGSRGRVQKNLEGRVLENTPPVLGGDVRLTLRHDLQTGLYNRFGEAIAEHPDSTGGVLIVLDVPTREVLALVSYPGYDPNRFAEDYDRLRADTMRLPLRFKAVANQYAPGSIIKPLACLAGLSSGRIDLQTRFTCTGHLFPDYPDRWRCWEIHGTAMRKQHGSVDVVEAIEGSCNVFLYHVGELVGVSYLTNFFGMFGFGQSSGIGLREEARGVNPTPDWLAGRNQRATAGRARLLAIGQAELLVTPVQAANMTAVYASGIYKPVTLVRGLRSPTETVEWELPVTPAQWHAIREGMYRVVNAPNGTAYRYARPELEGYVLCGKTGSATTPPRPLSYRITYTDEQGAVASAIVPAGSRKQAEDDFRREHRGAAVEIQDAVVHERWPPGDASDYSHAWFAGFLQPADADGQPLWQRSPRVAFAVLTEFGGSGGRTSGPIAKQVAGFILETLGPDLNPDTVPGPAASTAGGAAAEGGTG
jgi:cell division protein FtsI/penicillin-binding protein 2